VLPGLRHRVAQPLDAIRQVVANRGLLRLELASFTWSAAEAAYLVGLLVFAFGAGGTSAVAFVAVLRSLPSVVLAPLILSLADRVPRDRLLRLIVVGRVACVAILTAEVAGEVAPGAIYAVAAIDAIAAALLRPLRSTLVPGLARSPEEMVAANVATTTGDGLAALVGPAVAALLLAMGSIAATFVAGLVTMAVALVAAAGITATGWVMPERRDAVTRRPKTTPVTALRELLALRHARLIALCFVGQRLVRGMLAVLIVAASFDVLGLGDSGVGVLTSAIGLGGLIGGVVAFGLVGSRQLAIAFGAGLVAWGGGILLSGVVPGIALVIAVLALAGVGKVGVDVAGFSLLQRTVPGEQRGRIFGLLEGLIAAALAVGPVIASLFVDAIGPRGAIVVGGAVPLVLVALSWPTLRGADAAAVVPDPELRLLSGVPMFRPLQLTTVEQLAEHVSRVAVEAGEEIVRQGEPGRTFYIVQSGRLEALVDGQRTAELAAGDSFGEIALVRDSPRTATVRALEPSVMVALDRDPFLAAVSSTGASIAAADEVVRVRLASG